jgi:hypothetical protein
MGKRSRRIDQLRLLDTVEVWGSSPHEPTIVFSHLGKLTGKLHCNPSPSPVFHLCFIVTEAVFKRANRTKGFQVISDNDLLGRYVCCDEKFVLVVCVFQAALRPTAWTRLSRA